MNKHTIISVSDKIMDDHMLTIQQMVQADIHYTHSVHDLYAYFGNNCAPVNLIIFDSKKLCGCEHTHSFEITNMIQTMARIAAQKTMPLMAVWVDDKTDPKLLSEILETGVHGVVPQPGWLSVMDCVAAMHTLVQGHTYLPRSLLDRIIPTKRSMCAKKSSNTIVLTARQSQVLHLVCHRGASNKTIARQLKISESTVKLHISSIFKKYGVRNRTQLALSAIQNMQGG